ncbi:TetR/AcrR family transcriptional regulator [Nostoc sp. 3335mG]|nr:TetR/AcrR family transcriptional regulator [Nostoc sp. 3335mG]
MTHTLAAPTPTGGRWQEATGESDVNLLQCGEACRASRATARRQKLVSVARTLFAEQGFHGTGVAQLAAVSGIKVGQIYRDFADKEAIVAEIVGTDLSTFLHEDEIAQAVQTGDIGAIRAWLKMFVQCGKDADSRRLMPEIIAEAARNDRIKAIAHDINRRVKSALMTALTAVAPRPEQVEAREELADIILTISAGIMHRRVADPDFDEAAAYARLNALVERSIDRLLDNGTYLNLQNNHCGFVTAG